MKPRRLLINVLTALPVAAAIVAMCFAPDSVPMHYNTAGEADRWGSRWSLLLYPLIALIMRLVMAGLSKLVSKDKNGESYVGYMSIATIGVILTFDILALYSIYVAVVPGVAMDSAAVNERMCQAAVIATGICLIPVGRDLRDIPYNKNVGIKTKWSLANAQPALRRQRVHRSWRCDGSSRAFSARPEQPLGGARGHHNHVCRRRDLQPEGVFDLRPGRGRV